MKTKLMKLLKCLPVLILCICFYSSVSGQNVIELHDLKIKVLNNDWQNATSYYKNDTIPFTGLAVEYYVNSKNIKTSIEYKNGHTKHCKVRGYYENGKLELEYSYGAIDGMEDGEFIRWHENGKIKNKGQYSEGEPSGLWKYYDENGVLVKTESYKDGKLI